MSVDGYATFANFGAASVSTRPQVSTVTVPECIKRRLPSKHYVYKIVVKWTNGTNTVVYRRYSMFFDFLVKLQQLHSNICQMSPKFAENPPQLPELPGKILFGRSQIHQVAEKRRGKIEEFCEHLISLPPELSESSLVLGFFNTWPDDTLPPREHSRMPNLSGRERSKTWDFDRPSSPDSSTPIFPTSPDSPITSAFPTSDTVIMHPDEMENLEQYRASASYQRKDSHQVDLLEGQVIHVIEKHSTGWWMVMADDEQGYAPAAYLEPVEGGGVVGEGEGALEELEEAEEKIYEAMEKYTPQNDDEVGFAAGDRLEVLGKCMDGWWKIRCDDKVGFSPAALIRRRSGSHPLSGDFESEKSIYEGLNIHKPPPRRNTIDRQNIIRPISQLTYDVPRTNPILVKLSGGAYVEPSSSSSEGDSEDEASYYKVPRPSRVLSMRDSVEWPAVNGRVIPERKLQDSQGSPPREPQSLPHSPPASRQSLSKSPKKSPSPVKRQDSDHTPTPQIPPSSIYASDLETSTENPYEVDPTYQNTWEAVSSSPQYENVNLSTSGESGQTLPHPPPTSKSPKRTRPSIPDSGNDYDDIEGECVQTQVQTESHRLHSTTPSPPLPPLPPVPKYVPVNGDDYVDLDADNTYINPQELRHSTSSASSVTSPTPSAAVAAMNKPLPKPPLPATDPPKKRPKISYSQSAPSIPDSPVSPRRSGLHSTEDEYVEMDPVYAEVPPEDQPEVEPQTVTSPKSPSNLRSPSRGAPPPPPQPYLKHRQGRKFSEPEAIQKSILTRAKSLEDLLSSSPKEHSPLRQHSPPFERKFPLPSTPRVPISPSQLKERSKSPPTGVDTLDGRFLGTVKPKPAKILAGKGKKTTPNCQPAIFVDVNSPHSQEQQQPKDYRNDALLSPPSNSPRGFTSIPALHAPLTHSTSMPGESVFESVPKTYVAVSSYYSQMDGCLSFSEGDKCVLVHADNREGWWLVNIGGQEGWTPGEFWREEKRSQTVSVGRPPAVAPRRLPERKPRSHTVGDFSTELTSSSERSFEDSVQSQGTVSLTSSTEGERSPLCRSAEVTKPLPPPPVSAKPIKAKGPPPPKPKPLPSAGSPLYPRKKFSEKPPILQKPNLGKLPGGSPLMPPNTSPPGQRKNSERKVPSPPPPPARRKGSSPRTFENGVLDSSGEGVAAPDPVGEYARLAEARTSITSIDSAPWFVGKMERVQAEQFLKEHGRQREFLVRERATKDGYYALSIRYHYSFRHFNIDPTADGHYSMGTLTFQNIEEVIHHYQQNSLFIHDGQHVTLGQPVKRRTRPSDSFKQHV